MKVISVTCKNEDCDRTFRVPEFKYCSTIKNNPSKQECNICRNVKLLAKSTLYGKGSTNKSRIKTSAGNHATKSKNGRKRSKKVNINKVLDNAWSKLVKLEAGGRCEYCRSRRTLNSHHIYSRAKHSVRWDVSNGMCLCVKHHIGVEFSAHKTPIDFTIWLMKLKGEKWLQALKLKANSTVHFHEFEKELILKTLKEQIKKHQL